MGIVDEGERAGELLLELSIAEQNIECDPTTKTHKDAVMTWELH